MEDNDNVNMDEKEQELDRKLEEFCADFSQDEYHK
jgi:hypothetical protein